MKGRATRRRARGRQPDGIERDGIVALDHYICITDAFPFRFGVQACHRARPAAARRGAPARSGPSPGAGAADALNLRDFCIAAPGRRPPAHGEAATRGPARAPGAR
ncbi:hypothetical protein F7R21_31715, partial [Burkholderia latens]